MSDFQLTIHRSHYSMLALAAADIEDAYTSQAGCNNYPAYGLTGWISNFDGGGNVKYPSTVRAFFGDAALAFSEHHQEHAEFWSCQHWVHWTQEPGRQYTAYYKAKDPLWFPIAEDNGRNWIMSVGNKDLWEQVPGESVPPGIKEVLEKCITLTLAMFGHGADFFPECTQAESLDRWKAWKASEPPTKEEVEVDRPIDPLEADLESEES